MFVFVCWLVSWLMIVWLAGWLLFVVKVPTHERKGQAHTKTWMEDNCRILFPENDKVSAFVKDIAQQIAKLQETPSGGTCQVNFDGIDQFSAF